MEYMFMPLKRYADFSGRSRRMEYWMWVLFQFLLYLALWVVFFALAGAAIWSGDPTNALAAGAAIVIFLLIYMVIGLALLVPSLAVTVRRLHDTNRSGWWLGGFFIAYLALVVVNVAMMGVLTQSPDALGAVTAVYGIIGLGMLGYGIVLLVFMFLDGTPGPNRYGPDPKGRANAGEIFA